MNVRSVLRVGVFAVIAMALAIVTLAPAAPAWAGSELGFDVRFSGVVQTVGGDTQAWVIGGQTLTTDAETQVFSTVTPAPGVWADAAAKRQSDGTLLARQINVRAEQVRLRGPLQSKPDEIAGDWVIAGVTVKATADTKIGARGEPLAVGKWAEAVMTESEGVLTATNIIGTSPADAVIVSGELQAFSDTAWTLSGITLAVNTVDPDKTLISGTPVVGLIVHAAAALEEDNSLTAQVLRVAWIDRNTLVPPVDFTGAIEMLPAAGLTGEWTVDGKLVVVMPNTRIHQEKGLVVVGATVHVVGWDVTGKVMASEITVVSSPEEGGAYVRIAGIIEALPAEGTIGEWTIGGQKVLVTERTQVLGSAPEVGKLAGADGVKRASDGTIVATNVRVRFARMNIPTGTITPPARPTRPPRP